MAMAKKDYSKIAASKIHKPGEGGKKRFLIYSRNKIGKTTFAASGPNTLVIDPEVGTEELDDNNRVWPIYQWEDLNDVFKYLQSGDHPYEWVVMDGLTRLNNMALRFVMKQQEERDLDRIPGMVDRRDYGKSGELMKGMLFNFHNLNVNIIFTAQERIETPGEFETLDDDEEQADARFVPDLPKGVRSSVNSIVSGIGRLYIVRIEDKEDPNKTVIQRRLLLAQSEAFDTGFRSRHTLPEHLKSPTVPRLMKLIKDGSLRKVTK